MVRIKSKSNYIKGSTIIEVIISVILISLVFTLLIRIMTVVLKASPTIQDAKIYLEVAPSISFENQRLLFDNPTYSVDFEVLEIDNVRYKQLCITDVVHDKPEICCIQALKQDAEQSIFH